MTVSREFDGVQIRHKKKNMAEASTPRPGKIIVTPGKIELRPNEAKSPPIFLKISEIQKQPKLPKSSKASWICIDIIQNVEAKLNYVNLQAHDPSRMSELMDTLLYAWSGQQATEKEMFTDNADEIRAAPVHRPAPNAAVRQGGSTAAVPARAARQKITVDEEGSAVPTAHPAFNNDFGKSTTTAQPGKPQQKSVAMQRLFDSYGVDDPKNETGDANRSAQPVHEATGKSRPAVKAKGTSREKSYADQARRSGDHYTPVDSAKADKKECGLSENSFYGSPQGQPPSRTVILRKNERLDANTSYKSGNVMVTPGRKYLHDSVNEEDEVKEGASSWLSKQNSQPPQSLKSLTSNAAASTFDQSFKTKNQYSASGSSYSMGTKYKPNFEVERPAYSCDFKFNSNRPWDFKKQENIGNSCYMNATMQILAACPIFVDHLGEAFTSLQKQSDTIRKFNLLMQWLSGRKVVGAQGAVATSLLEGMRTVIKGLDAIFEEQNGRAQQDAEECLTAILGAVSDECTGLGFRKRDSASRRSLGLPHSPVKTPIKRVQGEGSSQLASQSSQGDNSSQTTSKKKMPASCDPVDLMEVKMRDVKSCATCGDTNQKDAMEHRVHLGIEKEEKDEDTPWTVRCLQQLLAAEVAQEETIDDFKCEKCKVTTKAIGTKVFVEFGEYIIIVLKRFGYDENHKLRKLNTPIRVPLYLEMANYLQDKKPKKGERQRLNETITIEESVKKVKASNRMLGKTADWLKEEEGGEDEEKESPVKLLTQRLSDSADLLDDAEAGGDLFDDANEGMEVDEVEKKEKRAALLKPQPRDDDEKIVADPECVFLDDVTTCVEAQSSSMRTPVKVRAAHRTRAPNPAYSPIVKTPRYSPIVTSPRDKQQTPVKEEEKTRRQSGGMVKEETTPKRKRQRANTERDDDDRKRLSSASHSEPSRNEKKSRIVGGKASKFPPPTRTAAAAAARRSHEDKYVVIQHVHIESSEDDGYEEEKENQTGRRSLEAAKTTPAWKQGGQKTKEIADEDPFEFPSDGEDVKMETGYGGGKQNKRGRGSGGGGGGPPGKKAPLTARQNGPNQETPVKKAHGRRGEKTENISPTSKDSMEQTGGGGRGRGNERREIIETSSEEDEVVETDRQSDEEEGGEEVNEVQEQPKEEKVDRRMSFVSGRSQARNMRRTRDALRKEEEEKEVDVADLFGDSDDDGMEEEEKEAKTEETQVGDRTLEVEEEKEEGKKKFSSSEGGFIKENVDDDEVVADSSQEEVEEEETMETSRDEDEDAPVTARAGEEEEDVKTIVPEAMETSGLQTTADFDTSIRSSILTASTVVSRTPISRTPARKCIDDDGEVKPPSTPPPLSPVTAYEEERKKTEKVMKEDEEEEKKEEKQEDVKEEEEEKKVVLSQEEVWKIKKAKLAAKRNEQRKQWRSLFVDTDPLPPSGHIMFRPVDDRWMRSQCKMHGLEYSHRDEDNPPPIFGKLRAQSSLCKTVTAPAYDDTIQIDGDGNCLFRALAWWVTGSEENHAAMRKKIVKFMFKFPAEFGARMTGDEGQKYTEENNDRMLNDGEWGTQCELYGAATVFGVDIYTYHEGKWKAYRPLFEWEWQPSTKPTVTRMTGPQERTRYGLYLKNNDNLHYDAVSYMEPVAPDSDTCYRLLGSILHHGKTACSGHYVADVYDQEKAQWLHCDDDVIKKWDSIQVLENAMKNGYVLVYGKNKKSGSC